MFIGRKDELQFLSDAYSSNKAELVILYGRRRIGKTETLRKFCEGKPHVFFTCNECTDKLQLRNFSAKLFDENIPAKQYMNEFSDWTVAFRSILDLPYGNAKKLIVIDEFPYMCKGNSSIPSILQSLWDELLKDSNVMLILCGSSMSFIEKELLAEKNPLYGRATGIYKMKEMNFYDAIQFFPNYSDQDKIIAYSILGGIPHYLKQFDSNRTLEENIKKSILSKGSVLYSEVEFLLHQELRETALYNSLIQAIALGNTKLNEISQKSLIEDTSKTSVYLKNLIELGIVERELSVDTGIKEHANAKRGIYRLTDNYFKFWYSFVFSNYSSLETGDVDGVYTYVIEPKLHEFASFTFEDVCRNFISELQKHNQLPFRYSKIGRWFGKTTVRNAQSKDGLSIAETEIDILAMSESKKDYMVGECKFKNQPFSYSEFLDLTAKLTTEKKYVDMYYMLFSKSGFDERIQEEAKNNNRLTLFDLNSIVNYTI